MCPEMAQVSLIIEFLTHNMCTQTLQWCWMRHLKIAKLQVKCIQVGNIHDDIYTVLSKNLQCLTTHSNIPQCHHINEDKRKRTLDT